MLSSSAQAKPSARLSGQLGFALLHQQLFSHGQMNHPAVHVQLRTGRREDPHTVFLRAGFSDGSAGHRPPTVRVGTKAGAGSATLYRWQAVPHTESISMKWRAHAGDAIGELLGLEGAFVQPPPELSQAEPTAAPRCRTLRTGYLAQWLCAL